MGTSPPKTKQTKTKPKRQYDSQLDLHCRHSYWYHCFTPAPFVAQHHRVIRKWKVRVAVIKQWLENVSVLCGDYTAGCSDWATRAAQTGPRGLPAPSAWPTNATATARHCVACVNWSAVEWLEPHTAGCSDWATLAASSQCVTYKRRSETLRGLCELIGGGVARTHTASWPESAWGQQRGARNTCSLRWSGENTHRQLARVSVRTAAWSTQYLQSAVEWREHTPPAGQSQREDSSVEHAIPSVCSIR